MRGMVRKEKGSPMYLHKVAVDEIVTNMVPLILVVLVGEFFPGGGLCFIIWGVSIRGYSSIILLFHHCCYVGGYVISIVVYESYMGIRLSVGFCPVLYYCIGYLGNFM